MAEEHPPKNQKKGLHKNILALVTGCAVIFFLVFSLAWIFLGQQFSSFAERFGAELELRKSRQASAVMNISLDQILRVQLNSWNCEDPIVVDIPPEHWSELTSLLSQLKMSNGENGAADKILLALDVDTAEAKYRLFFNTTWRSDHPVFLSYGNGPITYMEGDQMWQWVVELPQYRRLSTTASKDSE